MKKIGIIFCMILIVGLLFPEKVHAASIIRITINGKIVSFPDEKPFIDSNNRTMVPLRFVSQELGYQTVWNAKTNEVTITDKKTTIKLKVNSNVLVVNNTTQKMDTKMILKNGRTFVPLRFVTQAFGAKLIFNSKTNQIDIQTSIPLPIIGEMPTITGKNQDTFAVAGKGEGSATISYYIQDEKGKSVKGTTKSNADGTLRFVPLVKTLSDGIVTMTITQQKNGVSSSEVKKKIQKDTTGPTILLEGTSNVIYNNKSSYLVKGKTEAKTTVEIQLLDGKGTTEKSKATSNERGEFSATFNTSSLQNGNLKIVIQAKDIFENQEKPLQKNIEKDDTYYVLEKEEQTRWHIYDDGTHPLETTKGFNALLPWTSAEGIKTIDIPAGTFLISKGDGTENSDRINMVSNKTFLLNNQTVFQKETNGLEIYQIFYFGPNIKNITMKGGILRGDRDTHDFSQKGQHTGGTHEWGNGMNIVGAEHVLLDGIKFEKFTGDGVEIGGSTIAGSYITEKEVEEGGIDENGNPIPQTGKVRSVGRTQTNFDNPQYTIFRNVFMWLPNGVTPGSTFDMYYYEKDGSFISSDKNLRYYFGESIIPEKADYFRVVFDAPSTKGIDVNRMTIANSKYITIQNCDIGYNRRQGITAGGEHIVIQNNIIHDIRGTAPGSGIDIEPGFMPAKDVTIQNNRFFNNLINVVLAYGEDATLEGNTFETGGVGSVGVKIWEGFIGNIKVNKNTFKESGLDVDAPSQVTNNTFTGGSATFGGQGVVVDGIKGTDTNVGFKTKVPFGVTASNIAITMTGKTTSGISVEEQPVHLKNVIITGPSAGKVFGGNVAEGSIFENIQFMGYNSEKGMDLPRGTYRNCVFQANEEHANIYGPTIAKAGKFLFENCSFSVTRSALVVNHADAEITVKDSNITSFYPTGYSFGVLDIQKAKDVQLLNNEIHAEKNIDKDYALIRIGIAGWQSGPINVARAVIKGNSLFASIPIHGIYTLDGGLDAEPYDIQDNKLNGTTLKIRGNDTNIGNQ